jgi:hypothetical protein
LHRDEEDGEAHLPVVSSHQGKVYSGDAMMRRRVPVLFVGFVGSQRRRKLREMEGRRRKGGGCLGFGAEARLKGRGRQGGKRRARSSRALPG